MVASANESVVTYSCEPGFTLDGNSVRVCQSDGSGWDGSVPSCGKNQDFGLFQKLSQLRAFNLRNTDFGYLFWKA